MSDAVSLQAGYLLHYTQYGDTNFIVDFFSFNYGRVSLLAKGARSSKPRTRALYQPFRPLLLSWWGDHELRTLTGIEESGQALVLEGSALPCGYYLNEIVLRLVEKDQPQPSLFAHYGLALAELSENPDKPEPVLRNFELQLLDALGLLPNFATCRNDGEAIEADERYLFYPSSNQAVLVPYENEHIAIPKKRIPDAVYHSDGETRDVGVALSGKTLIALAEFEIDSVDVLREIKPLMRRLLQMHLGDKPLNSRELFSSLTPPPPPASVSETSVSETSEPEKIQPEAEPESQSTPEVAVTTSSTSTNKEVDE